MNHHNNEEESVNEDYDQEIDNSDDLNFIQPDIVSPMMQYDNEWVRFLNRITEDASMLAIVAFFRTARLTDNAKRKLATYTMTILDREFAVSRIKDRADYLRVMDDKHRTDADITLGLTRFDLSPDFHHGLNLINMKFGIKTRRSVDGFERKILATQRTETIMERREPQQQPQHKSGIRRVFGR